jgi:hypothetical protein
LLVLSILAFINKREPNRRVRKSFTCLFFEEEVERKSFRLDFVMGKNIKKK